MITNIVCRSHAEEQSWPRCYAGSMVAQVLREALKTKGFPKIKALELEDDMLEHVPTERCLLPSRLSQSIQV